MHGHGPHTTLVDAWGGRAARLLLGLVAVVGAATLLGLVVLWPSGDVESSCASLQGLSFPEATVIAVDRDECSNFETTSLVSCDLVTLELTTGADAGDTVTMQVPDTDRNVPELSPGDPVVLQHNPLAPAEFSYTFWEFQRQAPLLALVGLFVIVVVAFGRWQGVRALAGLGASVGVVVIFLLPGLLEGQPAMAVALIAASMIAFVALYLAHGVSLDTTVALVGTLLSLVLIAALAAIFVSLTYLTGLSGDDAQLLRVSAESLDPAGILLAGIIIGALGVLDDVTVTQVATVAELRDTDPSLSPLDLYRRALRVGRDHIAATVNTLVLAYVGASLSILLFFVQSHRPLVQVLGQEVVAIEIVRTLVGSIGLVAAVPVTTALAAFIAVHAGAPIDPRPRDGSASDGGTTSPHDPPVEPGGATWDDFAPDDRGEADRWRR
jgi:uncharacterized membrane protein